MAGAITKSARVSIATPDWYAPWISERTVSPSPRFSAVNRRCERAVRIEATPHLGDELKLAQIKLREVTLPDQAQDVRQQELPVPPGRFMGGQDPLVHPSLDGRHADAESPGDVCRADVLQVRHASHSPLIYGRFGRSMGNVHLRDGRFNGELTKARKRMTFVYVDRRSLTNTAGFPQKLFLEVDSVGDLPIN